MKRLTALPDVFKGREQLTFIIESLNKEIADTFDISVKVPVTRSWRKEHQST